MPEVDNACESIGCARDHPSILVTPHIKIDTRTDAHSYIYYLSQATEDQANVSIEKVTASFP